jgi:tRNA 2-thiouridine synthesizing protein A
MADSTLDLRGVRCPTSWAKAKVHFEGLARGTVVELLVDDPRAVRDIPRAAEASGHVVTAVTTVDTGVRITIEI